MKNTTFAERFKLRLDQLDISAAELSRRINISEGVISQYKSGKYEPKQDRVELFAKELGVTEAWLMGFGGDEIKHREIEKAFSNIFPIQTKKIPLLGSVACGEPIYKEADRESYILSGTDITADFCLRCEGDSMINARILDGDIVFIRKQETVEHGEIAAVAINDEATLKRVYFYPEKNTLILKAENPKFDDLIYMGEDLRNVKILGKAVAFQSDVR